MAVAPFSVPTECFEQPSQTTFKFESGALKSCPCSGATCTTIATLPRWKTAIFPSIQRSADGETLLITYGWARNARPTTRPDLKVFSTSGAALASLPYGTATMDPTGQIILHREALATGGLGPPGIVNLATGNIARISGRP